MKKNKDYRKKRSQDFERHGGAHSEASGGGATEDLLSPRTTDFDLRWLLARSSAQLWSYCSGDSEPRGHERFG